MKTAIFIPARMGSTRLPGKPLLKINEKTVIEALIERVKSAKMQGPIVLCTTTDPEDMILVAVAKRCGIKSYRGEKKDILKRYLNAVLEHDIDFIVNVDGDDIFCDPELIGKTARALAKTKADFIKWEELPLGASPCGIKAEALMKVCEMKEEIDTETGWGRYFTDTGIFKVEYLRAEEELRHPEFRMTLDYPEDMEFFKAVFERLYVPGKIFSLRDIIRLLEKNPDIVKINEHVQKAYEERLKRLPPLKLNRFVRKQ